MTRDALTGHAARFGVSLSANQRDQFDLYRDELLAWNRKANLTAIVDPEQVAVRHFADSLSALLALEDLRRTQTVPKFIDVGTGAGFPGLPLKLAWGGIELTLLESTGKKTAFLKHLVEQLGLSGVCVLTGRAEDEARSEDQRERYDVALSRALGRLPVVLELCLPFVRVGGRLVAHRHGDLPAEQAAAVGAAAELGGAFRATINVDLGYPASGYGLVVVDKIAPTPARYPRRSGVPAKRPLA